MHRLALTIVLTAQGIPFLHAGTEFFRTKNGVENSYNSGDSINAIDWRFKKENGAFVTYVQDLIRLRKAHPAFRMTTAGQVAGNLVFDEAAPKGTIAYTINGAAMNDTWKKIWIGLNGSPASKQLTLPAGNWKTALQGAEKIHRNLVQLEKFDSLILYQE